MRRRVLIGVAGSAMVAVAVLGAYALFGREADAAPLEECEWVEAFHIDFTAEVAQPTPEEALAWFLEERARPDPALRVPMGEYEVFEVVDGPLAQVHWRFVNERNEEMARLVTEEWPDGGWTVIGGTVCRQRQAGPA